MLVLLIHMFYREMGLLFFSLTHTHIQHKPHTWLNALVRSGSMHLKHKSKHMHLCFQLTVHCVCIMVMFMFLICSQKQSIEMRRETVIRSLILYLGEKEEELFEDCLVWHDFNHLKIMFNDTG